MNDTAANGGVGLLILLIFIIWCFSGSKKGKK